MSLVLNGDTGVSKVQTGAVTFEDMPAGSIIQVANYTTGTMATGTTTIPLDNTIPQITEGTQFMSLVFTPKKANSTLKIEVVCNSGSNVANNMIVALFRDSGASAIAVQESYIAGSNEITTSYVCFIPAVSIAQSTFTVRVGGNQPGTTTFNGRAGVQQFGGALASSITIEEIAQ